MADFCDKSKGAVFQSEDGAEKSIDFRMLRAKF